MLYAPSLDGYISAWQDAGEAFLPLSWVGEDATTKYYSIIKQVPNTQVIFELVSDVAPTSSGGNNVTFIADDLVRVAASAFEDNGASSSGDAGILTPLAVSKGVSNMTAVDDYYTRIFKATLALEASATYATDHPLLGKKAVAGKEGTSTALLHAYKLEGAAVQIRFVERPAAATAGDFTVAAWEAAKLRSFAAVATDPGCGFSKWYDNHYAWDQETYDMETFTDAWDEGGWAWHVWLEPNNDVYVADPTGDTVQMDTSWSSCSSNKWCASALGNGEERRSVNA